MRTLEEIVDEVEYKASYGPGSILQQTFTLHVTPEEYRLLMHNLIEVSLDEPLPLGRDYLQICFREKWGPRLAERCGVVIPRADFRVEVHYDPNRPLWGRDYC